MRKGSLILPRPVASRIAALEGVVADTIGVVPSAALHNAWFSGFASDGGVDIRKFKAFVCCSSGAPAAVHQITGQEDRAWEVWTQDLPVSAFVDECRLLRGEKILDFVYYEQWVLRRINEEAFHAAGMPVFVVLTRLEDGEAVYMPLVPFRFIGPLKATCAVPVFARSVSIGGVRYIDGYVADPIPVHHAAKLAGELDCNRVVVFCPEPKGYRMGPERWWRRAIACTVFDGCGERFLERHDRYNQSVEFAERHPQIHVVRPSRPLLGHEIHRRPDWVAANYLLGQEDRRSAVGAAYERSMS